MFALTCGISLVPRYFPNGQRMFHTAHFEQELTGQNVVPLGDPRPWSLASPMTLCDLSERNGYVFGKNSDR